ncbi:hypothetical protein HNQ80_001883 [Anaerosolibacter carboniphilus]|uniref:PDZ domain-containing protein n=1 Tax=Anaerosolibacter carboniphilus TaxID=1417629 RepID=A0A841KXZ4_9FIRM|nr:PDZ domain-containing protein [Anaerosolibacter carboniphilus]MBB6215792.1 hypothetical protein [Anaerosolibacter carboniphilus]
MVEFLRWSKTMVVILAVGGISFLQYKKIHDFEYKAMGFTKTTLRKKVLNGFMMGVLGGSLGTIVILMLGVTIEPRDFIYLLPMAFMLMLINVRYVCFAYGGGLLGIVSLLLGLPKINIPSLMTIVGVLHLVESILIWLDGHRHATPIFIEDEKYGIVGGFLLQRFWPIPFIVLLAMMGTLGSENLPLPMSMFVAVLGYSDMALSSTPNQKSKTSAIRLLTYSAILILLSVMAKKYILFQWIAVSFAALGHEALVLWGQKEEKRKAPLFRHHRRGITVLDVKMDGSKKKMDLNPGDVILRINNHPIYDKADIQVVLSSFPQRIWMEIIDAAGKQKTIEYKHRYGMDSFGLIIVPQNSSVVFLPSPSLSPIKKWIESIKK